MASPHEQPNSRPELLQFPNALRSDGQADTYINESGELWLVPRDRLSHEFSFSEKLYDSGLSRGQVTGLHGSLAVKFPSDSDLIPLPSVMNEALQSPEGAEDVVHILELTAGLAKAMQRQFGRLPDIPDIDIGSIAFDRNSGKVEWLAPYLTVDFLQPTDLFMQLRGTAMQRSLRPEELALVKDCFSRAQGFFKGTES